MKNLLYIVIAFCCLIACQSSKNSKLSEMNSFVNGVEQNSSNYSTDDWEIQNEKMKNLINNMEDDFDSMSKEEKDSVLHMVGRYYGVQTKHGLKKAFQTTKKALESIPDVLDGFLDGLNDK